MSKYKVGDKVRVIDFDDCDVSEAQIIESDIFEVIEIEETDSLVRVTVPRGDYEGDPWWLESDLVDFVKLSNEQRVAKRKEELCALSK